MFNINNNSNKYANIIKNKSNILNYDILPNTGTFKSFMTAVFSCVSLSLLITFITGGLVFAYIDVIPNFRLLMMVSAIAQVGIVFFLSYKLRKGIKFFTGLIFFFIHSIFTGITLSVIAFVYNPEMIFHALAITTLFFVALCIVGHLTNYKMLSYGRMLFFALIFFVGIRLVSYFLFPTLVSNPLMDLIGIIIFGFYTVYDYQAIKYAYNNITDKKDRNILIIGSAITLYLNFINLFIYILRLFSRE